jgi:hypothetical protein
MHETLRIGGLTGLLSTAEIADIKHQLAASGLREDVDAYSVESRNRSVHSIEGQPLDVVKRVYEPLGRIEFDRLPDSIADVVSKAVLRRLDDIRTVFPSVNESREWFYVEYRPGQFITPHMDYYHNDSDLMKPKICAISVLIDAPESGGEFFVESGCDERLWAAHDRAALKNDYSSDWFKKSERLRWYVKPAVGDATLWGTQTIHGTEPVASGSCGKLIGFLGV